MDRLFAKFANATARAAGSPYAFILCVLLVLVWAALGPMFHYSETWQLIINTSTTIITFLMVFLIQNTQNRDGHALQTKLDELIRSSNAEDEFMGIEKLSDKELDVLHARCEAAAKAFQVGLDKTRGEREKRSRRNAHPHPPRDTDPAPGNRHP
ncbi:Low affinity iron permease family protein [Bordetella sputigena]|uniref:low affinity iron permease family protein n=1 Tax=Bordetella sputigena TaxID=1416810 RepID=UPI0039F0B81C